MHSVLIMAMKDLLLIRRDWLGMFFIVGFPILMGVFFASLYPDGSGNSGSNKLDIAVVDEDSSPQSQDFIQTLRETDSVNIEILDRQEAIDKVRRGWLVGMIVLPVGYARTAGIMWREGPEIELGLDPSRQAEAGMFQGLIMQASGKLMMDRMRDPASMRPLITEARERIRHDDDMPAVTRNLLDQMMGSLDRFLSDLAQVQATENAAGEDSGDESGGEFSIARIKTIDVTRRPEKGSAEELVQKLRSKWDISFPQAMLWGILACAATFAISIVRERKQGTLLRLQAAPVSRTHILLGKAAACFLTVLGVIAVMVGLGTVLGMRPESPVLLAIAALCVAFCFVGIMALMSVLGSTEEAVSGAAWGANMLIAMFGGGMIPLALMPQFMTTLSVASPGRWSILALEGAIWRDFTPAEMLLPCGVLVATGAACLILGSLRLMRAGN
jgi:ABC-2 type transport system permease protein